MLPYFLYALEQQTYDSLREQQLWEQQCCVRDSDYLRRQIEQCCCEIQHDQSPVYALLNTRTREESQPVVLEPPQAGVWYAESVYPEDYDYFCFGLVRLILRGTGVFFIQSIPAKDKCAVKQKPG